MTRVVWAGDSKTGLGIKIGSWQQKLWRSPHVKLMGNPAVCPEQSKAALRPQKWPEFAKKDPKSLPIQYVLLCQEMN